MSVHIKTADLCERCAYNRVWCNVSSGISCAICEMHDGDRCKCLTIKENTPCPYFEEEKDNAAD